MSTLTAENLAKRYRRRVIIEDVSISVKDGEVVGLLGPNGAGKSTCFYMIVGLIRADAGRVRLDDQDITRAPVHKRALAGVGYLAQEASIFRKLSVYENILAALELRRDLNTAARKKEAHNLIQELHLDAVAQSLGISLSGGERRRAEIARALAAAPRFLLLDEPFAGVDPIAVNDIQNLIRYLSGRGIGVLITDHNVRETLSICDRSYILSSGRVLAQGDASTLIANDQVRNAYLGENFRW